MSARGSQRKRDASASAIQVLLSEPCLRTKAVEVIKAGWSMASRRDEGEQGDRSREGRQRLDCLRSSHLERRHWTRPMCSASRSRALRPCETRAKDALAEEETRMRLVPSPLRLEHPYRPAASTCTAHRTAAERIIERRGSEGTKRRNRQVSREVGDGGREGGRRRVRTVHGARHPGKADLSEWTASAPSVENEHTSLGSLGHLEKRGVAQRDSREES